MTEIPQDQRKTLPDVGELRHLLNNGESIGTLADRYGVTKAAVERALHRAKAVK